MPTIFDRIVAGEIPCHKVWEDERHLAFLDINPVVDGHTLLVPKSGTDYLFDLSTAAYAELWDAARRVEKLIRQRIGCRRVVLAVYGFEVPHCHIHLLPSNDISDVAFPPRDAGAKARLAETVRKLCREE